MKNADLDALFKQHLLEMLRQTQDAEALEDAMSDLYLQWLQSPNDALGGIAPGAYYCDCGAQELVDLLSAAVGAGKKPSDPLLDAIVDKPETQELLLQLVRGNSELTGARLTKLRIEAVDLLNQMCSADLVPPLLAILADERADEALRSAAAQAISAQGEDAREALYGALADAGETTAQLVLDLLCDLEPDERTTEQVLRRFELQTEHRAYYARLLARCGDARAIGPLRTALAGEGYYTFTEIRNAIEALGETVDDIPDFSGDADYEKTKEFMEKEPKGNA